MTLAACWIVFPLVLTGLALGCGLLVERIAGLRLSGALLPAVGLCVMAVVGQFTTLGDGTAELTVPLVVGLSIVGFGSSQPWRDRRIDRWAVVAAVAVYLLYGAPILLSGDATFAGYLRLDDTASWLAIAERALHEGVNVSGLAPSTHEAMLDFYLNSDYPVGGLIPLGVGGEVVGQDYAWVWQPYLSLLGALLALSLYSLLGSLRAFGGPLRAGISFLAAQPALVVGYALWGGFKEVGAALLVVVLAAVAADAAIKDRDGRQLFPLAVVSAAMLAVLSSGGGVWLVPFLAPVLFVWFRKRRSAVVRQIVGLGLMVGVLAAPALLAVGFLGAPAASTITDQERLANLIEPLSKLQIFGIWPAGDFRLRPEDLGPTHVLIAVAALAAALGAAWAWRARQWTLLLYGAGSIVACVVVVSLGSPWVAAKALAIASPAVVLAALLGTVALHRSGRRVEALVVAAALTGGLIWSNALAYHTVNLAPRERGAELEQIGKRFAGHGPALMTEYEPFGARYFLRQTDPESAGELRRREVRLRNGGLVPKGGYADIDSFSLEAILVYRLLVLRRSPTASRPPAIYRRVWEGKQYEVWERPDTAPDTIIEHLPLGDDLHAAGIPLCDTLRRMARRSDEGTVLAAAPGFSAPIVDLSAAELPPSWVADRGLRGGVEPGGEGVARATVVVERPGAYEAWLGGSVRGEAELKIDGRRVGAVRSSLSNSGQYSRFGVIRLGAGTREVELHYGAGDLHPGSGGRQASFGPIVLSPLGIARDPTFLSPRKAQSLCGKPLDWLELVRATVRRG